MIKIAVDGMGGDYAPEPIVKGSLMALEHFSNIKIILFGDKNKMAPYLKDHDRLEVVHTDNYLSMGEEDPIKQYRTNKEASLFMAMQAVKDGKADAIVSAGPTQALVVGGHFIVRRMKEMKRVAIAPVIPNYYKKGIVLLDAGANVDFRPEHLLEYAIYSSIFAKLVLNRENPKIALINIGTEETKGRTFDLEVYKLLKENNHINFIGNIEPKEILTTEADVVISDGFTANIVMKTVEGTAKGMSLFLKDALMKNFKTKLGALLLKKQLNEFKKQMSPEEIGGALIMGLEGVVIKSQGASKELGLFNGIRQAKEMVENDVVNKVKEILSQTGEQTND